MANFRPQTVGALRDALEHMPAQAPVHVHVSIPSTGAMYRAPLLSVHTMPGAVELGGAIPPTERTDISGSEDEPGDAIVTRHDDGTVTVQQADPVIAVAPENLALVADDHVEDDGTLVLDTAGEYRYQRVGERNMHGRMVIIYRRVQRA